VNECELSFVGLVEENFNREINRNLLSIMVQGIIYEKGLVI